MTTITPQFAWFWFPAAATVGSLCWVFLWPVRDTGYFGGGVTRMFMLIPALLVSAVAWAIAGALK